MRGPARAPIGRGGSRVTGVAAWSLSPRDRISLRLGSGDGVGIAGTPSPPHWADLWVCAQAQVNLPDRPRLQPTSADGAGAPAPRGPRSVRGPALCGELLPLSVLFDR